jgi:hypothetical protein
MSDDNNNDTMLSRSGRSDPGGKLVKRLDIPVSEELEEGIIALAAVSGVPKSEFARQLLERFVFGELGMLRRIAHPGGPRQWDQSPINSRD